jgi:hypothetical protein
VKRWPGSADKTAAFLVACQLRGPAMLGER